MIFLQNTKQTPTAVNRCTTLDHQEGSIICLIANVPVVFLIDSGAEVNTINGIVFSSLMNDERSKEQLYSITSGTDKSLRAYASPGNISVWGTFVAALFISEDRPCFFEKFYVINDARSLLGKNTALRYSVLQIGLNVSVQGTQRRDRFFNSFPGEMLLTATTSDEFPKFNVPPVVLTYDASKPPARNIFTNIPLPFRAEAERRLGDLMASGIIEPVSDSMDRAFCSSLLVVPKGKDDIRLVVDLRGPNKCIVRTPFRMPTLEEILSDLRGAKWFSTIDWTGAFFHVEIAENSRHLTNFFAGNATYRFKRLPFGLCNAPDIFQEILQTSVLAGCPGVCNYLDDILVHGRTKEEHDENLNVVLRRLHERKVKVNMDKCVIGQQSVKFLGFSLSHEGLRVEDEKLRAIEEFRTPETVLEVKSFLGLMDFSERFIPRRADRTKYLRELAKSDAFYWSRAEEEEFLFFKHEALKAISRLGYFNYEDATEIYADVSPVGLGAVLAQFDKNGTPRIIACASKALTQAEKKYPQTQKDALAIVWGVERFAFYLTGKSFAIRTDSEANEFIFGKNYRTSKREITRAESWALRLQTFDFVVKRIPGHLNVADALSRLIAQTRKDEPFDEDDDRHFLYTLDGGLMNVTWKGIELAAENDTELFAVKTALQSGCWPEHLWRYKAESKCLRFLGPMIFKEDRIVLPRELRSKIMATAHEGHVGCATMKRIMREYFWWPGMTKDVEVLVKDCETCLVISQKNPSIPLANRILPDGPWQVLQIDLLSIPGCGSGKFLVVIDTYARYIAVVEMKSIDAKSTNMALTRIFYTWGLPLTIHSNNGPPFQSSAYIEHWEDQGVKINKSIPLNPLFNDAVERLNQGIIEALAGANQEDCIWKESLQAYVHTHNTIKPHSCLGITPFELLVSWKYRGTVPSLWDRVDVRGKHAVTKLTSKKYAELHREARQADITAGDIVILLIPRKTKTDAALSTDRYTVLVRQGPKVLIQNEHGVQYIRNVSDTKQVNYTTKHASTSSAAEPSLAPAALRTEESGLPKNDKEALRHELTGGRKRTIRKPERSNNMFLHRIYQ